RVDSFELHPYEPAQRTVIPNPLAQLLLMNCIAPASFAHAHTRPRELSTATRLKTIILGKFHSVLCTGHRAFRSFNHRATAYRPSRPDPNAGMPMRREDCAARFGRISNTKPKLFVRAL